jgi:hypothetical protein
MMSDAAENLVQDCTGGFATSEIRSGVRKTEIDARVAFWADANFDDDATNDGGWIH